MLAQWAKICDYMFYKILFFLHYSSCAHLAILPVITNHLQLNIFFSGMKIQFFPEALVLL